MLLTVPQGQFMLDRLPLCRPELLQAWDAADEYLLNYLADELKPARDARILILNDMFGALATALNRFRPHAVSDSFLSQQATRLNFFQNDIPLDRVRLMNILEPLEGMYDLVLIKVPKTLALLEDELIRLRPYIASSTKVILAGMIKSLPSSVWSMVQRLLGPASTALARKKSRLIFATPEMGLTLPANPYPVSYRLENTNYLIGNHANVFSRDSLDVGTRLLLQHLPSGQEKCDIVDLGCGNGVVGLIAAERNPEATVHFVDESFMAVASAKDNFFRAFGEQRPATFRVGDGLTDFQPGSADLILCNPPFHQQHAVVDRIAAAMFKQARKILRKNGELWVIGNRHLNYHGYLDRLFGSHSVIAANPKFVLLKTRKGI